MADAGWLYEKAGETKGPVSREALLALLEAGELEPGARVRLEGEPEWRAKGALETLAETQPAGNGDDNGAADEPGIGKFRETCLGCFVLILLAAGIVWFFYTGEPAPAPEPPAEEAQEQPEPEPPPPPRELSPEEIAPLAEKATVYVECLVKERDTFFNDGTSVYGSGVLFQREDLRYQVLTNARTLAVHWMLESDGGDDPPEILDYELRVTFSDGVSGTVAGVSLHQALKDYALVAVDVPEAHYPVLPFAVEKPAVGEKIYTMGHPGGLTYSFASGVVSQQRSIPGLSLTGVPVAVLQHDAPMEEGAAGGPLINRRGELAGINTQSPAERVNLAVAVQDIQRAIDSGQFLEMPLEPDGLTEFLRQFFDDQ